jgi:putative hydrolase
MSTGKAIDRPPAKTDGRTNALVADRLRELANLLEQQNAGRFRVAAYRRAADTVESLQDDPSDILKAEGIAGLIAIPDIGDSIARAIEELVSTGRWMQLERLRGEAEPFALFTSVPGIGPETARRIEETLNIDTLEALEIAAHDGRLESVPGIGPRKAAAIRASLAAMLARRRPLRSDDFEEPDVRLLLEVDRIYRRDAAAGRLRRIAPKRFNPNAEAWLPILHLEKDGWTFSVLFSNTALAHQLGRTDDWVVIYFHRNHGAEHQRTVVTETRGPLQGSRVVRGREAECRALHADDRAPPVDVQPE